MPVSVKRSQLGSKIRTMKRSREPWKYVSYLALLLMFMPTTGGWKFCPKKGGMVVLIVLHESTQTYSRGFSRSSEEASLGDTQRCSCKKGNSCPIIPRAIAAAGRSLSRAEQASGKSSTQFCRLDDRSHCQFAPGPPGTISISGFTNSISSASRLRVTTVLLI